MSFTNEKQFTHWNLREQQVMQDDKTELIKPGEFVSQE